VALSERTALMLSNEARERGIITPCARHGSSNPWLYGGQHRTPESRWQLDRSKEIGGIEVILTRLVDDANEVFDRRRTIWQDAIDLPPFKRRFVSLVL
jgi:hypothetical protein